MVSKGFIGCAALAGAASLGAFVAAARADAIVLGSVKDNTLYQDTAGALSNGSGEHMFCGRTGLHGGFGTIHRALVKFDVGAAIPPGSTITAVSLTLNMSKSIANPQTCTLHRVNAEWGEGASDAPDEEGMGTAAVAPDATWLHTMYSTSFWATPGGDFEATASANVLVSDFGVFYTWGPTPGMIADVQGWLDDPSSNHGWVLRGNESAIFTAMRWDTRENPDPTKRPVLRIEFTGPCPIDYTADGVIDVMDYLEFLQRYEASDASADLNGDGFVEFSDYLEFLNLYEIGC